MVTFNPRQAREAADLDKNKKQYEEVNLEDQNLLRPDVPYDCIVMWGFERTNDKNTIRWSLKLATCIQIQGGPPMKGHFYAGAPQNMPRLWEEMFRALDPELFTANETREVRPEDYVGRRITVTLGYNEGGDKLWAKSFSDPHQEGPAPSSQVGGQTSVGQTYGQQHGHQGGSAMEQAMGVNPSENPLNF